MGDYRQEPVAEDLFQHSLIVQMEPSGVTKVKLENLDRIFDAIDTSKYQEDTPSAVIAITGPTERDKFILLNILFDALERKGEKTEQPAELEEFDKDRVALIQRFLKLVQPKSEQGDDDRNSQGIFLWPEPFLVKNNDGGQLGIWILNVCKEKKTNSVKLDESLALLCSRFMEMECCEDNIRIKISDPFRPLPVSSDASFPEPVCLDKICFTSIHPFRCSISLLSDNPEYIIDHLHIGNNLMKNLNVVKGINKLFKSMINTMMEETVVVATSSGTKTEMQIGRMKEIITSVTRISNEHGQQRDKSLLNMDECIKQATGQIKLEFLKFVENWMKTQFSMTTTTEILELYTYHRKEILETFESKVNTTLWEQFTELVDDRCKKELEGVLKHGWIYIDMLTNLIKKRTQLSGYLSPQKLNEIIKEVREHVENFAGEGKNIILNLFKLAHERIRDAFKEKNKQILENEKNLFVQNGTELANMYYVEVEKYLSNASYAPPTLDTVRQDLLSRFSGELKSTFKAEAKEELRRQEENAKLVVNDCISRAAAQFNLELSNAIRLWMLNNLHISTINQMLTIYDQALQRFIESQEHRKIFKKHLYKDFVSHLDARCRIPSMNALKSIFQPVSNFNKDMRRQLGLQDNTGEEQTADEVFNNTGDLSRNFVLDVTSMAMGRLVQIYQRRNEISFEALGILTAYCEQMQRWLEGAPHSPQTLHSIHTKLAAEFVDKFKKAFQTMPVDLNLEAVILNDHINQEYEKSYKSVNEEKIRKQLQEEVKKVIQKMKIQYNDKVQQMFKKYPDGLDAKTLTQNHSTIATEVKEMFELEIREVIGQDEPLEPHKKILNDYIDKHWQTVVDTNGNKRNKKKR